MILGRKRVNQFAKIHLILEEKFRDDPLPCGNTQRLKIKGKYFVSSQKLQRIKEKFSL